MTDRSDSALTPPPAAMAADASAPDFNPFAGAIRPMTRTLTGVFVVLLALAVVLAAAVQGMPVAPAWPMLVVLAAGTLLGIVALRGFVKLLLTVRGAELPTIAILTATDRGTVTLALLPGLTATIIAACAGIALRLAGQPSPLEHMLVMGLLLALSAFTPLHAYISLRLRAHVNEALNGIDVQTLDRWPPAMLAIGSQFLIAGLSNACLAATYFGLLAYQFYSNHTVDWPVARVVLGVAVLLTFGIVTGLALQIYFKSTLARLNRLMRYLREGRLRTRAPFLGLGDLGALGLELSRLHGDIGRHCAYLYRLSQGDTTVEIAEPGAMPSAMRTLTHFLRQFGDDIRETLVALEEASANVLHTAINFETNAYEHAVSAQESGQTIEGLWEASREISRESQSMRRIADDVAAGIERTAEQIHSLVEHQVQIEEILDTVREIAERSDILALNASLEGVRAGEAGRGFALVAAEMRRMAEKVKAASNDIRDIVNGVRASARVTIESTEAGRRMGETLTKTAQRIMMIANQQQTSTGQVTRHMQDVGDYLQITAGETQVASSIAQSLTGFTHQLETILARFMLPEGKPVRTPSGARPRTRSDSAPPEAPFHHDSADFKALATATIEAERTPLADAPSPNGEEVEVELTAEDRADAEIGAMPSVADRADDESPPTAAVGVEKKPIPPFDTAEEPPATPSGEQSAEPSQSTDADTAPDAPPSASDDSSPTA